MENLISNTPVINPNAAVTITQDGINGSVGLNGVNNPSDVLQIQDYLKALGYPIISSGSIANSQTDTSIISILNFQANNKIVVTGLINPNDETYNTLKQLNRANTLAEGEDESLHQPFLTNSFLFRRNAGNANTLNVIFEGDSWLDYPVPRILDLYDTITDQNQRLNLNCLHLAKFGETTSQMYADRAHFVQYVSGYRIDRIYFSGGGNDVFPQLGRILNAGVTSFDPGFFTDTAKLNELKSLPSGDALYQRCILYKRYLNTTAFDAALFNSANLASIFNTIMRNYLGFGSIVNAHATPNTIFYMHTYDYPLFKLGVRPSIVGVDLPLGPWIKPVFDRLGITDEILKCYIIIRLLDKFYALLWQIKNHFNYYGYRFQSRIIDYRGVLNSSEFWRDEIHPNSAGARRLSTRVNF